MDLYRILDQRRILYHYKGVMVVTFVVGPLYLLTVSSLLLTVKVVMSLLLVAPITSKKMNHLNREKQSVHGSIIQNIIVTLFKMTFVF